MHDLILYDGQRFSDCFRSHYRRLCYFALRYVGERERAEDVVEEVFMHLLEGGMVFRDGEHLRRWLYTAVRNACLNAVKLADIRSDILGQVGGGLEEVAEDSFCEIVRAEVYARILEAVEELPAECGKVFRLAYLEGCGNEEVAERLGISVNTVKSQKNKAKIQLREKLRDLYPLALLVLEVGW